MTVREVSSRRDRETFIRFPWSIYEQIPQWVPPLVKERRDFLNPRKHPFFKHGAAAQFLAFRGDEPVGRISASDDPRFNEFHGSNVGCFGMFESIDDPHVAESLFDAADQWLAARGRTEVWGPIDYSTNYPVGLLIDGFEHAPRVMMNYNPPYYASLIEHCGFTKAKDLFSWWFTENFEMRVKWKPRAERILARGGVSIRPFDFSNLETEARRCREVYNEAWRDNWGFVPMSDAEFLHILQQLRHLAIPELLMIAEHEGKPVGFSMMLPDFNEALHPLNGRLFSWGLPIGLFRFMRNQKHIRAARLLALGVAPAWRRRAVAELLILRTIEYGKDVMHYDGGELGWTLEDNERIIRPIRQLGAVPYKTYRIYHKPLI